MPSTNLKSETKHFTLYTNISLNDLKNVMRELSNPCFKGGAI